MFSKQTVYYHNEITRSTENYSNQKISTGNNWIDFSGEEWHHYYYLYDFFPTTKQQKINWKILKDIR